VWFCSWFLLIFVFGSLPHRSERLARAVGHCRGATSGLSLVSGFVIFISWLVHALVSGSFDDNKLRFSSLGPA
jgi:hypothetical protein